MLRYKTWFLIYLLPLVCLGQRNDVLLSCGAAYSGKDINLIMNLGESCNALYLSESMNLKAGILQNLPLNFSPESPRADRSGENPNFQYRIENGRIEFSQLNPLSSYHIHVVGVSGQLLNESKISKVESYQMALSQLPQSAFFIVLRVAGSDSNYSIKLWNL